MKKRVSLAIIAMIAGLAFIGCDLLGGGSSSPDRGPPPGGGGNGGGGGVDDPVAPPDVEVATPTVIIIDIPEWYWDSHDSRIFFLPYGGGGMTSALHIENGQATAWGSVGSMARIELRLSSRHPETQNWINSWYLIASRNIFSGQNVISFNEFSSR